VYLATVLSLYPVPASLTATLNPANATQIILQLQGQSSVPYVIQSSSNLIAWTSVSTNTPLGANTVNITNTISPSVLKTFWRAIWQPRQEAELEERSTQDARIQPFLPGSKNILRK
jgi:hypothetical protein